MRKQTGNLVKDVARITGVTIRTLHHYEAIGLLVPQGRTTAGYRVYGAEEMLRLQQILIQRALGLSLEQIRQVLDDPGFDQRATLRSQRRQLENEARRMTQMIRGIDHALALLDQPDSRKTRDMSNIFEGFDPAQYEVETIARWGQTDAYRISTERVQHYTPIDWAHYKTEHQAICDAAVAAMRDQEPPDGTVAMDIADWHRLSIDRWFYPCSQTMHARLADLYEADTRFAEHFDRHANGLTTYLVAAIRANALRVNLDSD